MKKLEREKDRGKRERETVRKRERVIQLERVLKLTQSRMCIGLQEVVRWPKTVIG